MRGTRVSPGGQASWGYLLEQGCWVVATSLPAGVGVPLMLTYVYGVVMLSLCRSRWGCGSSRSSPGDLGVMELENLTKCES